jgi:hypothetical protein
MSRHPAVPQLPEDRTAPNEPPQHATGVLEAHGAHDQQNDCGREKDAGLDGYHLGVGGFMGLYRYRIFCPAYDRLSDPPAS